MWKKVFIFSSLKLASLFTDMMNGKREVLNKISMRNIQKERMAIK
jgi:hypothetical protein